jgi:hypothetical protein
MQTKTKIIDEVIDIINVRILDLTLNKEEHHKIKIAELELMKLILKDKLR